MEAIEEMAREAYERAIGLDLADVAVDCCITKAPCGGEKAGTNPVDRGKRGLKRSTMVVDAEGIALGAMAAPANRHDSPLLAPTLDALPTLGGLPESRRVTFTSIGLLRLERHSPAIARTRAGGRDLREGQAGTARGDETVGRRTNQLFLDQRPQEASVVHREGRASHRLLDRLLECDHHREEAHPRSLDPLPLGGPT